MMTIPNDIIITVLLFIGVVGLLALYDWLLSRSNDHNDPAV